MSEKFGHKLACTICRLAFGTEDIVYSTSCGHIFHFACLNSWKAKSAICPQCRHYNPTMHRVYFSYETDLKNTGTSTSTGPNCCSRSHVDELLKNASK